MYVKDTYCVTGDGTGVIKMATEACGNRNCKEIK